MILTLWFGICTDLFCMLALLEMTGKVLFYEFLGSLLPTHCGVVSGGDEKVRTSDIIVSTNDVIGRQECAKQLDDFSRIHLHFRMQQQLSIIQSW